jgi:hypothetical protein
MKLTQTDKVEFQKLDDKDNSQIIVIYTFFDMELPQKKMKRLDEWRWLT